MKQPTDINLETILSEASKYLGGLQHENKAVMCVDLGFYASTS